MLQHINVSNCFYYVVIIALKVKVTYSYGDPYLEFVCCIYPIKSVHTHTVNTHPEQWAAIYAAAPGEQLGIRCLAQGHLSYGIEVEKAKLYIHSPTDKTQTHNLWITSPTL